MRAIAILFGLERCLIAFAVCGAVVNILATKALASYGATLLYSYSYSATPYDSTIAPTHLSDTGTHNWQPGEAFPISLFQPTGESTPPGVGFSSSAYADLGKIGCFSETSAEAPDPNVAYYGTLTMQSSFQDSIQFSDLNMHSTPYKLVYYTGLNGFAQGDGGVYGQSSASVSLSQKLANGPTFTTTISNGANANRPTFYINTTTFPAATVSSSQPLRGPFSLSVSMTVITSANADGHGATASGESDFADTAKFIGLMAFDQNNNPLSPSDISFTSDSGYNYQVLSAPPTPAGVGDFDDSGVVNMADYVVWRDNLGKTVLADTGNGADGNGNGVIDAGDYAVWRAHFGQSPSFGFGVSDAVPEPSIAVLLFIGCALGFGVCRR